MSWLRVAAGALVVSAIAGAWYSGFWSDFSVPELAERMRELGPLGPLLFLALFCVGELVQVPSVFFVLAAALIWPTALALPLAWLGSLAAATTVFTVARWVAGPDLRLWILARIPERWRRVEEDLTQRGLRTVILIRLLTFMMPWMHWLLGASRVRFRDATLGTAIGVAPGVIGLVLLGEAAIDSWDVARPWVLGALAIFVAVRVAQRIRLRLRARGEG